MHVASEKEDKHAKEVSQESTSVQTLQMLTHGWVG